MKNSVTLEKGMEDVITFRVLASPNAPTSVRVVDKNLNVRTISVSEAQKQISDLLDSGYTFERTE